MPLFAWAEQADLLTPVADHALAFGKVVVSIVFTLALIMFAWGIVKLITAAGDPEKLKAAKGHIIWGIIGMTVLASLFGLITFLQTYFGITGQSGTIPIPGIGN